MSLPANGLLSGVRVLDLSRVMAGPYCASMLADAGAEVIKIETAAGEDSRHIGPFAEGATSACERARESAYFMMLNRGKKSITLDLKSARGLDIAKKLAAKSDVLIENFRPGVADRLGIGYSALAEINPRLVYASVTGFGQSGPFAARPAYDLVIQAMSGLMSITGFADGPPMAVGDSICDVATGMFAAWGISTALAGRAASGRGCHLDVAMLDSMFSMLLTVLSKRLYTGAEPSRVGNRHPVTYPVDEFRARDGYVVMVSISDAVFARLMKTIGRPELIDDPRFRRNADRDAHEAELRAIVQDWIGAQDRDDIQAAFDAAEIPCGPVWSIADVAGSAHIRARGMIADPGHPKLASAPLVPQPVMFDGARPPTARAPLLGEHNDTVLRDLLGLSTEEIETLKRDRVI
ncbi:MAG: CoA transferase [Rhodospirillaceae bacterium]|nr:CoA transferase [Rhodospirillaceae bacterium]